MEILERLGTMKRMQEFQGLLYLEVVGQSEKRLFYFFFGV
jgi:hypothetical protein